MPARWLSSFIVALLAGGLVLGPVPVRAETVVFGTVGAFDVNFAPMFVATELGYFAKEHIEIQLQNFGGATTLLPQIAAKRVTVGFPNPEPLIFSRDVGKPSLPVVLFYNVLRKDVWEFAVPDASPIRTLRDLKGKRIGVFGLNSGNIPITKAILAGVGLQDQRDYELVPVGLGAPAILALQTGKVDALNLFEMFDDQLAAAGTRVRLLPVPARYENLISNGFAANVDTVRDQPDLLIRFARAIAKGTVACQANFPGCMRTMWKYSPTQRPPNLSDEAALKQSMRINYRETIGVASAPRGHYGEYDPAMWRAYVDALHEGGSLSTSDIPIGSLYTNALIKQINAFDYDAVRRDAARLP
jgi:NitT/TauT family transport system substrate-binding protein